MTTEKGEVTGSRRGLTWAKRDGKGNVFKVKTPEYEWPSTLESRRAIHAQHNVHDHKDRQMKQGDEQVRKPWSNKADLASIRAIIRQYVGGYLC